MIADYEVHKLQVLARLKHKVNHAISNNQPLFCIGFQLADFSLSDLNINKRFTKPVYFSGSQFFGYADFKEAIFQERAVFSDACFQGRADFFGACFKGGAYFDKAHFQEIVFFSGAKFEGKEADFNNSEFYGKTYLGHFNGKTKFNYVLFEGKDKVIFDIENLSNVCFMNTDITGVRFNDKARWGEKKVEYNKFWGGKKVKEDRFKIIDERLLEGKIKEKDGHTSKDFNLGSIKTVYRSIRENYEYRMRYDEAGQFFIREMELKRLYKEIPSKEEEEEEEEEANSLEIKQNNWFKRNLFSLTGWYYHLS